jgi:putative ABC transport system permease protein
MGGTKQSGGLRKSLGCFPVHRITFFADRHGNVYKQIQYMRKQSLGINVEQTLVIKPPIVGMDSTYPLN